MIPPNFMFLIYMALSACAGGLVLMLAYSKLFDHNLRNFAKENPEMTLREAFASSFPEHTGTDKKAEVQAGE